MSIKFRIRNISEKATKEGDAFVRFTGKAEPYSQASERDCAKVGVDGGGNPRFVFITGLNLNKVDQYRWYTEEEKAEIKKQIKEVLPTLKKTFGEESLDETNKYFWKEKREVNRLVVTHESENFEFDTSKPIHALLYFAILAGAFIDVVAPTKEWAERNQILHYLHLETDDNQFDGEEDITRADAFAALTQLRKEDSIDGMFILAWCLQYDTTSFGAYTKSTSARNLANYHIQYIDGKLKPKGIKKIKFPKTFLEYAEKWNSSTLKAKLYTEAYIKAGEYYSFINQREKKYVLANGTVLGNTIPEVVENLHKPKSLQDYEYLRDLVEAKWKE
jgi:hypothetical protein